MPTNKETKAVFLRNVIFGVEDSLVSTVGLLSGIALDATPRSIVLLTGFVYIFVEGFSMAIGSFLSEESTQDYLARKRQGPAGSILGAVAMLVSFIIAGFIPLIPYLVFGEARAILISVVVSILVLFGLGVVSGKVSKTGLWSRGLRMAILGGLAIIIGVVVSHFFKA
jgi:VIT1/CCC1 family predicted Fe2+/Mn2+ transporter